MIINSTNDNLPMNRHSIKAGVMGVRWLCAVASFILLKTKKGRDFFYITLVSLSMPKIAPIAKTPMKIFLGVNILADCVLLAGLLADCVLLAGLLADCVLLAGLLVFVVLPVPVYSFTRLYGIGYTCPLMLISTHFAGLGLYTPPVLVLNVPSIISPTLKTLIVVAGVTTPCLLVSSGVPMVYGAVKIYFAITNFFSKCWYKHTDNFLIFYKFAKFEVRGLFVFNKIKFPITTVTHCSRFNGLQCDVKRSIN